MDWGGEARRILKTEMQALSWGYRDLSEHLGILGVEMDPPAINRRINRGNFSAAFLLMCLKAMRLRIDVVPEGSAPKRRAEREKPIDALESVIEIWGTKAR
ncbi:hypothetical protein AYR66_27135 [Noviherbaspirillum denitrificans]|uniref:DUF6471 domain-containing protein n=2 Tax=Noviherbaspirillum denitrificans TaxID=1968433 RepID=A0A254TSC5_9BURK|nr:hypothetical protein AYR66_27135 [Noviherbaspirillum denitrificans]